MKPAALARRALLASLLATAAPSPAAVLWNSSDPICIRVGAASGPKLRFQLDGPADSVEIAPAGGGASIPLTHEGGNLWSVTLTAAQALSGYVPPATNLWFAGFLRSTLGGTTSTQLNVLIAVADHSTPPVRLVDLSPTARRSERLLNLRVADLPTDYTAISQRLTGIVQAAYAHVGDDYDFVNLVFVAHQFPQNRYHAYLRNSVQGIGLTPYDQGSSWGSAARLIGLTVFPNLGFYNAAETAFSHETGHQWINFSTFAPLRPIPHWPPSTMARNLMGFSIPGSGAGGEFNLEPQQQPNGSWLWKTAPVTAEFGDLDLYYMGLASPDEVAPQVVTNDPSVQPCAGCPLAGGARTVTISEIIAAQGARSPDTAGSRRRYRFLTIVVSRDRLLNDDEMALLDALTARGEATAPLAVSAGVLTKLNNKPWRMTTRGRSTVELRLVPSGSGARDAERVVPVVLDVATASTRFTTELSLTNLSPAALSVPFLYISSVGAGSGTGVEALGAGEQRVIPDAIAWLRGKGLEIPTTGSQVGTLRLQPPWAITGPVPFHVTARTTAAVAPPLPSGAAGLAYAGAPPSAAYLDAATVYGLRQNTTDRSNLAVINPGSVPVSVRITAWNGAGDGRHAVLRDGLSLPAGGWIQINGVLAEAGFEQGWVTIERTSAAGSFGAYGVINDNVTDDGSFAAPVSGTFPGDALTLPVLVESATFRSELVLANRSAAPVTFTLSYLESLQRTRGAGGTVNVVLPPGSQRIIPEALGFLRANGAAVGSSDGVTLAGAVRVTVSGAPLADVFVGARTAAQVPGGSGQFGLFYAAVPPGREAGSDALVPGLRSGATTRSNVAVLHAGSASDGPVTLELQVLDGAHGLLPASAPVTVTLAPGGWAQPVALTSSSGLATAAVRIRRTSGSAPWIAYGVVNDGGIPGERTGDGAFVDMVVP